MTDIASARPALVSYFPVASFGEELGMIGLFGLLALYALLVERGLRTAIGSSRSLADILLDARVTLALHERSDSDIHAALREAGAIIVALPPSRWLSYIDRVTEVLGVPPGTVHKAVLDADSNTSALRKSTAGPQRSSRSSPPNEHALRTAHTGQVLRRDPPDLNLPR